MFRLMCRIATNDGVNKVGFVRNLAGQAEKWVILKAYTSQSMVTASDLGGVRSHRRVGGEEEPGSLNRFVRSGDHILLQPTAPMAEYLLSLHEGADGREIRLQHREKVVHGFEFWQVELHGGPSLPSWYRRPYLRYSTVLLCCYAHVNLLFMQ
jgi:hypothetical protein